MPASARFLMTLSTNGVPLKGTSALGALSVRGFNLVPKPAARIIALIRNAALDYILPGLQTQSFFFTLLWHLRHSNLGFSERLSFAFCLLISHIVLPTSFNLYLSSSL
jgi:hypothetical protein